MRTILGLVVTAITMALALPVTPHASAATAGACNAGFAGCLAKCGNVVTAQGPSGFRASNSIKPTGRDACFANCRAVKQVCTRPHHVPGPKKGK